jgi:acetyl esterase
MLADARAFHDQLALSYNGTGPADIVVRAALACAADGHGVSLRVYEPAPVASPARLLWVHGGGFVFGSLESADSICRRLATAVPCTVVSVDYRLGPEHTAAQSRADVDAAWQWMVEQAAGADPAPLAVGGDSAGATLAALLAHRLRDRHQPPPHLQLLVYPVTALDESLTAVRGNEPGSLGFPWGVEAWLAGESAASPAVSPLHGRLDGTGAVHLVCGAEDLLADQDARYVQALRAAGVEVTADFVDGMPHGFFPWDCGVAQSLLAVEDAVASLRHAFFGTTS